MIQVASQIVKSFEQWILAVLIIEITKLEK